MSNDKLYGLVLVGGKSTRMGTDKSALNYHGVSQQEYTLQLLQSVCHKIYLSISQDNVTQSQINQSLIIDKFNYESPLNGLLSAYEAHPNEAWLVLPCDVPLVDTAALAYLIKHRDASKMATVYASKEDHLPQPLIGIWEASGLKALKSFVTTQEKKVGPRHFLIQSDVKLVYPKDESILFNANYKEDYVFAKNKLKQLER